MNTSNKTALVIAFVVVLLLLFGVGRIAEATLSDGMMENGALGGTGWMWIPTALLMLGVGALFVWAFIEQKK